MTREELNSMKLVYALEKVLAAKNVQGLDQKLVIHSLHINCSPQTKRVDNLTIDYGLYSVGLNGVELLQTSASEIFKNNFKRPVLDENGVAYKETIDIDGVPTEIDLVEGEVEYWERSPIGDGVVQAMQNTINDISYKYE